MAALQFPCALFKTQKLDRALKEHILNDRIKNNWWLKNKAMLKIRYGIPKPASYGGYDVTFWNFGSGYKKEDKYDRRCFQNMNTDKNRIEKDAIFSVDKSTNSGTVFTVYDGDNYRLDKNGKIVRINED